MGLQLRCGKEGERKRGTYLLLMQLVRISSLISHKKDVCPPFFLPTPTNNASFRPRIPQGYPIFFRGLLNKSAKTGHGDLLFKGMPADRRGAIPGMRARTLDVPGPDDGPALVCVRIAANWRAPWLLSCKVVRKTGKAGAKKFSRPREVGGLRTGFWENDEMTPIFIPGVDCGPGYHWCRFVSARTGRRRPRKAFRPFRPHRALMKRRRFPSDEGRWSLDRARRKALCRQSKRNRSASRR